MEKQTVKSVGPYTVSQTGEIKMEAETFPFPVTFTFQYLIEQWRALNNDPRTSATLPLELLESKLQEAPELLGPIKDQTILYKHQETVDLLVSPFFPNSFWNLELQAIGAPFSNHFVHVSHRLEKLLGAKKSFTVNEQNANNKSITLFWRLLYAYKTILAKFYNLSLVIDQPIIHTFVSRTQSGLNSYFKLLGYHPFMRVKNLKKLPSLDKPTFNYLVDNFHDMDLWMQYLPPKYFEFTGFTFYKFIDVTVEEASARLEHTLLTNQGDISDKIFEELQQEFRILFRRPDLQLGLASIQGNGALNFKSTKKSWNSLRIRGITDLSATDIDKSVYGKVLKQGKTLIIEDLNRWENPSRVESVLLKLQVKNLTLVPLFHQNQLVGLLEITSPNPGEINTLDTYKLKQVIPFFARAIYDHLERFENKVQNVVKETYTAIHPTVEWRFRESAIKILNKRQTTKVAEPEAILFENVYPLYAAADIRGSSDQRNKAIRDDLLEHLGLARSILQKVHLTVPLAVINELDFISSQKMGEIEHGMSPGHESSTIEFILNEVNPLCRHLFHNYEGLRPLLQQFMDATQGATNLLFRRRNAYESSLKTINETISNYLLLSQQEMQGIYPHYFEKYQTDGVEYNIYAGQSLVKNREFDPVYLKNLRLHQLITSCEIARIIDRLQPQLEVPLEITQLILVHSAPINIKFRLEEKQFDVDGAYNIRYEILKKRIDKATVKGSDERLTQPGQIAVIYSMDKEAAEYSRYLNYLRFRGYLKGEPEYLELDVLQSVQGLKALRFKVDLGQNTVAGFARRAVNSSDN